MVPKDLTEEAGVWWRKSAAGHVVNHKLHSMLKNVCAGAAGDLHSRRILAFCCVVVRPSFAYLNDKESAWAS